jgi:hypothetical protein
MQGHCRGTLATCSDGRLVRRSSLPDLRPPTTSTSEAKSGSALTSGPGLLALSQLVTGSPSSRISDSLLCRSSFATNPPGAMLSGSPRQLTCYLGLKSSCPNEPLGLIVRITYPPVVGLRAVDTYSADIYAGGTGVALRLRRSQKPSAVGAVGPA